MSGRKYLCHAKDDNELQAIIHDLDTEMDDKKQQIEFLLKRASQLSDEAKSIHKKHWARIEVRLRGLGKLPADHSTDDHMISFDEKDGIFYWDNRPDHPLMALFQGLKH